MAMPPSDVLGSGSRVPDSPPPATSAPPPVSGPPVGGIHPEVRLAVEAADDLAASINSKPPAMNESSPPPHAGDLIWKDRIPPKPPGKMLGEIEPDVRPKDEVRCINDLVAITNTLRNDIGELTEKMNLLADAGAMNGRNIDTLSLRIVELEADKVRVDRTLETRDRRSAAYHEALQNHHERLLRLEAAFPGRTGVRINIPDPGAERAAKVDALKQMMKEEEMLHTGGGKLPPGYKLSDPIYGREVWRLPDDADRLAMVDRGRRLWEKVVTTANNFREEQRHPDVGPNGVLLNRNDYDDLREYAANSTPAEHWRPLTAPGSDFAIDNMTVTWCLRDGETFKVVLL